MREKEKMYEKYRLRSVVVLATTVLVLATPALADFERSFSFNGSSLELINLVGEIQVEPSRSRNWEVVVSVRGADASEREIEFDEGRGSLEIQFPVSRHDTFIYPALGRGRVTVSTGDSDSWLGGLLSRGERVKFAGRGRGYEAWADVVVRVPSGGSLEVQHGVGKISANDIDGELDLDLQSGGVSASSIRGALLVDTGSGKVDLTSISGDAEIDTGSGGVTLSAFEGDRLSIDTGSGTVLVSDVRCRDLVIDTGSGRVQANDLRSDSVSIDTGSGSVELDLTGMGSGHFLVDTGSGSITLRVPSSASADVVADTGSGGIEVDLSGIETLVRERDMMHFRVGGGTAKVRLDTGSGRIRVSTAD